MTNYPFSTRSLALALLVGLLAAGTLPAQETGEAASGDAAKRKPAAPPVELPGLTRLAKDYEVFIDMKNKQVVLDGEVCLREGPLEMFACSEGTKEHEAVVAVKSPARFVHAALLAVGAKVGHSVRFRPEYRSAAGTTIDIYVYWKDKAGKTKKVKAQEWIKNIKTDRAMAYDWVFAGSGFTVDEETGERHYHADGGDFICVSNFSTATLDLPVKSSQDTADLLFAAFTQRIPPLKTPVRMVLVPRLEKTKEGEAKSRSATESAAPKK